MKVKTKVNVMVKIKVGTKVNVKEEVKVETKVNVKERQTCSLSLDRLARRNVP